MTMSQEMINADPAAIYKFALAAAEMAANTRAVEVVLLDLRGRSPVTEFFILATGTSPRQMRTVAEEIQDLGKRMGFKAWHTSGVESAKWILVDCVSVVAHIFDGDSRDFYDLELLWGDCPRIDWRKELGLPAVAEVERGARIKSRIDFGESAGLEDIDAEEEEARLEGDVEEEEGDADIDEDAELDAPMVIEIPDESTGSNSVEFVEVDPPSTRRKRGGKGGRGRSIYPTTIGDEDITEEERSVNPISDPDMDLGGRSQSTDEDEQERKAERQAADDVEGVSTEDLAQPRRTRPIGAKMKSRRAIDASIAKGRKTAAKKVTTKSAIVRKKAKPSKAATKKTVAKKAIVAKKTAKKSVPVRSSTKKSSAKKKPSKATVKKIPSKKTKSKKPVAKKPAGRGKKK